MNPVYALWWRLLDDARFGVRWVCGRRRKLAACGVFTRWLLHLVAGNVVQVLTATAITAVVVWSPLGWLPGLITLAILVVSFEVWFQVLLVARRGSWLHGWRLWWRVRRSIPAEWAESAVKSQGIKSALGGENRIAGLIRPVADHPKTAWWPRVEWPVVSVWCGHPPGRSTSAFVEFQRVLAANILRVDDVHFDFARDRDSVGRLQLTFVDVLSKPVEPVATQIDTPPEDQTVRALRVVRDAGRGVS